MKKEIFVAMLTEKENAMNERVETVKNSIKSNMFDILCDYEIVADDIAKNRKAHEDVLHIFFKNKKENALLCYFKAKNEIYIKLNNTDFTEDEVKKIADKLQFTFTTKKYYRIYANDETIKAVVKNTETVLKARNTSATKKTSTTKKAVKKEA